MINSGMKKIWKAQTNFSLHLHFNLLSWWSLISSSNFLRSYGLVQSITIFFDENFEEVTIVVGSFFLTDCLMRKWRYFAISHSEILANWLLVWEAFIIGWFIIQQMCLQLYNAKKDVISCNLSKVHFFYQTKEILLQVQANMLEYKVSIKISFAIYMISILDYVWCVSEILSVLVDSSSLFCCAQMWDINYQCFYTYYKIKPATS